MRMKQENIEKLIKAQTMIHEASRLLMQVADDETEKRGTQDSRHFARELQDLLICDNGEAGFMPFVSKMIDSK